jgi:hypothetical protein
MVHQGEGGTLTLRVDNAWTIYLSASPTAGQIDTSINNGFKIAKLTGNLTVVIPSFSADADANKVGRKITIEVTQAAVNRTVTWTGGAGGYQFAKAGSTIGPTQAQFDAVLLAMANDESLKTSWEYDFERNKWLCTGLAGPYV